MPKLVYFDAQGRAQAIRYLLDAKGVKYEDQRVTFAEWNAIKQANTYGEGSQLPILVLDDGSTYWNQSFAILKALAMEHGYMPTTPACFYEVEWFYSTAIDILEKTERFVTMQDDPAQEGLDAWLAYLTKFMNTVEERLSDGRAHLGGNEVTYGDFSLLALVTSYYENPNGKHEFIKRGTATLMAQCPNVNRVLTPMKEMCEATIAGLNSFV